MSSGGGDEPQWRRDGKELFYLAPDTTLMAVDVQARDGSLVLGAPRPLFVTNTDPADVGRRLGDGRRLAGVL